MPASFFTRHCCVWLESTWCETCQSCASVGGTDVQRMSRKNVCSSQGTYNLDPQGASRVRPESTSKESCPMCISGWAFLGQATREDATCKFLMMAGVCCLVCVGPTMACLPRTCDLAVRFVVVSDSRCACVSLCFGHAAPLWASRGVLVPHATTYDGPGKDW